MVHPVAADLRRDHSGGPSAPPNPEKMTKKAEKRERRRAEREARKLDTLALTQAQEEVEEGRPRADTLRRGDVPGTSSMGASNAATPENASPWPKSAPSTAQPLVSASQSLPAVVQWRAVASAPVSASQETIETSASSAELEAGCVVPGVR